MNRELKTAAARPALLPRSQCAGFLGFAESRVALHRPASAVPPELRLLASGNHAVKRPACMSLFFVASIPVKPHFFFCSSKKTSNAALNGTAAISAKSRQSRRATPPSGPGRRSRRQGYETKCFCVPFTFTARRPRVVVAFDGHPRSLYRFAFSALNFAHRAFVAFEILALAAADITRSFLPIGCSVSLIRLEFGFLSAARKTGSPRSRAFFEAGPVGRR